ncbi:hypothetical protein LX32DRAFT_159012 [Colletotrichum zoysiae]|uniref:Uncharacterized protein n=1 Tax=Colletotrichum zoysiae TaxID=1216348 RepID=A0AAD9LWG4_9PEZI|nr:hypothetical protein LX32DRAFT_159012 [Colletotrichum zoysiae]
MVPGTCLTSSPLPSRHRGSAWRWRLELPEKQSCVKPGQPESMRQSTSRPSARAWYAELLASRQPPKPKPADIIHPSRFSNAQIKWRPTGQTSRPRARARKPRPSAVKVFVFRTRDVSVAKTLACELATLVVRAKGCSQAHHLSRAEPEGNWAFHTTSIWMHMNAWGTRVIFHHHHHQQSNH